MTTTEIPPGTPKETIFYVTFGFMYAEVKHPLGMHPDGYAVIIAPDMDAARALAFARFGKKWAFVYDHLDIERGRFNPEHHPAGVLAVYQAEPSPGGDAS